MILMIAGGFGQLLTLMFILDCPNSALVSSFGHDDLPMKLDDESWSGGGGSQEEEMVVIMLDDDAFLLSSTPPHNVGKRSTLVKEEATTTIFSDDGKCEPKILDEQPLEPVSFHFSISVSSY